MTMSKGRIGRGLAGLGVLAVTMMVAGAALAAVGHPTDWNLDLQGAGSPIMESIRSFHTYLVYLITVIAVFVLALLVVVMVRFNAKANPTPSRTTHNSLLEIAWTIVPVVILLAVAFPSFKLLFQETTIPKADLTVKVTGKQWFWTYTYPDSGDLEFDSTLACDDTRTKCDEPRLLAVNNELVVPVNKVIRLETIAADVIHSFSVPSFGIKMDAVPGRLNETWFQATREGMYYGQCSQLCGRDHGYMPIAVRVVSEDEFNKWLDQAKKKFAAGPDINSYASNVDSAAQVR